MRFSIRRAALTRSLLASLAFIVATSWSPLASALTVAAVERDETVDRDYAADLISRKDCEESVTYTFRLTDVTTGTALSVWGTTTGDDCSQSMFRSGASPTCFLISDEGSISTTAFEVVLNGQQIPSVLPNVDVCIDSSGIATPRNVNIYFLLNESQGNVPRTDFTQSPMKVDMVGPPPPTGISIGLHSDSEVLVQWTPPTGDVTDVAGYAVFCGGSTTLSSSTSTSTSGAGGAAGSTAAFGAGGFVGAGGAGGSPGVGGAGGMMGTGGTTGDGGAVATSTTTSTTSGGDPTCSSPDLVPDQIPSGERCADVTGSASTSAPAPGNPSAESAYAVASFDALDNVGPLSEVACGTPKPVTDFFEEYRRVGGAAGGGFCNCALVGADAARPLGLGALFLGALGLALRRRSGVTR